MFLLGKNTNKALGDGCGGKREVLGLEGGGGFALTEWICIKNKM